jgi:DNA-binding transcriptional ArsR family regulator
MHLVPADQIHRRIIDKDRICQAIAGVGDPAEVQQLAERFTLLADPHRLALLKAINTVSGISVSDLAVATRMNDTAVSQALRLLRVAGVVAADKDGRVVRYRIVDEAIRALLPPPPLDMPPCRPPAGKTWDDLIQDHDTTHQRDQDPTVDPYAVPSIATPG